MTNEIIESFKKEFKSFLDKTYKKDEIYSKFLEIFDEFFFNFKSLLNSIDEAVIIVDEDGFIKEVNNSFLNWLKLRKEDVLNKPIDFFLSKEKGISFLKNSTFIPIEIKMEEFEIKGKKYKKIIAINIKQRVEIEVKLKNILRLYKVLTQINELIIRAVSKEDVYKESCEILVKEGHFDFAWIGEVRDGKIIPVSWYGENEAFKRFLSKNFFKLKKVDELIKTGFLKESNLKNEEKAFCNKITIPIFKDENAISAVVSNPFLNAVLVVYYKGKEFENEEISLLKQIAHDIGFGIVTLSRKENIDYLAYYDVLTSLPNRRYFFDELESLLEILKQKDQKGVLTIIDINNFKTINSTIGFWAGDIVLYQIAKRLKKALKHKDLLARVGGDKFGIFLYNVRNKEEVIYRLSKVLENFEFIFEIENKKFLVTISAGAAVFPDDGFSKEALFASAEAALKEAKKRGKGIEFYLKSMKKTTLESLNLESELVEGIKKDEFVVYYQPIIDIQKRRIAMAEALLRWKKGDTLIAPYKFIPILEERGLIKEVGLIVIDKVFKMIKEEKINIPISINVSAKQIHIGFYYEVISILKKYNISPKLVILEITESVLMENLEVLLKNINELTKIGIRFEIDDFGTGYSSLAYLKKLSIYALKIDRSFIKDLPENEEDVSISKAIISMGHSLGKKIIAEGVETKEQVEFLKANGCDYIQGFYFSKPLAQKKFIEYLKKF